MDYYNYVMHNSPALDVFDMWTVKCYGLLQLCEVLHVKC